MDEFANNRLSMKEPDSIFLFGNDVQTKINSYTKSISEIILYGHGESDSILREMKQGLDTFEVNLNGPKGIWKSFIIGKVNIRNNYVDVLANINRLELALKLQEAKLIKDVSVFKHIIPLMIKTGEEIERLIDYGNGVLRECTQKICDAEEQTWVHRLENRMIDLKMSHTILLQTQKQVELLMTNDVVLIDRIMSVIGTTIPIWRTQVALLLGIEQSNEQTILQNKIVAATEKHVNQSATVLRKEAHRLSKKKDIDVEGIKKLNDSLATEMDTLSMTENENQKILTDTKKIILET